jgi:hypothetical protein
MDKGILMTSNKQERVQGSENAAEAGGKSGAEDTPMRVHVADSGTLSADWKTLVRGRRKRINVDRIVEAAIAQHQKVERTP